MWVQYGSLIAVLLTAVTGYFVYKTNERTRASDQHVKDVLASEDARKADAALQSAEVAGWKDLIQTLRDQYKMAADELVATRRKIEQLESDLFLSKAARSELETEVKLLRIRVINLEEVVRQAGQIVDLKELVSRLDEKFDLEVERSGRIEGRAEVAFDRATASEARADVAETRADVAQTRADEEGQRNDETAGHA